MLRPSTAPRWKMAMRTFGRAPGLCAQAVRTRKRGTDPRPSRARAPDFMNARRVPQLIALPSLELGRAQHEGRDLFDVGIGTVVHGGAGDLRIVELRGEHAPRLGGRLSLEHRTQEHVE